jgi:deoxyguanosine kinase
MQVAVSGPVGAGKTTLTRGLAQALGWLPMVEAPDQNPFLPSYYRDPRKYAFAAQAWFQIETLGYLHRIAAESGGYVLERTIDERHFIFVEPLISAGFLSADETAALELIVEKARDTILRPWSLMIALRCPPDVLVDRIRRRGKDYECGLDEAWFISHSARYEQFWEQTNVRLLNLDATQFDFRQPSSLDDVAHRVRDKVHGFGA